MSKAPKKHDDDVLAEAAAIGEAARRFAEWKSAREDALDALILTYADDDAARLLAVLREYFWSGS